MSEHASEGGPARETEARPATPPAPPEPRLVAGWEATARGARRLQIAQVAVLVALGALAIVTVIALGGRIISAEEDREARKRSETALVVLRDDLRKVQSGYWEARATEQAGAPRGPIVPPDLIPTLIGAVQTATELAADESGGGNPKRRAAAQRTLEAFEDMIALAERYEEGTAVGSPEDQMALELARPIISRIEAAMGDWVAAEGESVRAADRRARDLTESLVRWMVGLILGIAASALALGLVLGRARRRLDEALRRATRRLAALADSTRLLAEAGDDRKRLVAALSGTVGAVVGDVGAVRLVGEEHAPGSNGDRPAAPVPGGEDPFERVIHAGAPLVTDGSGIGNPPELAVAKGAAVRGLAVVPLRAHGRVLGALGALRTESDDGYDEEELLFLQDLADRAALALDNARLQREASRAHELERMSDFKSTFIAKASHELRTPLAAIIGYSELLLDEDPDVAELHPSFARTILESGRHLRGVIDDLLDLQRIESGKLRMELRAVDLREVVAQACRTIAPLAGSKPIELRLDLSPEPVMVVCDDGRLHQVLINLLGNAVKFTDAGTITASAWRRGPNGVAAVRDTGRGIPPEELPLIWQEFHQVDGDDGGVAGSGLGLAIARRLVQMQAGDITCSSTPEVGSTFTVTLPGTR